MTRRDCFLSLAAIAAARPILAVDTPPHNLTDAQIQEIIQKFAAKETQFAKARDSYAFRQTSRLIEFDDSNQPAGQYELVSDITFNDAGKRIENVVYAPVSTLQRIIMTPEDLQDMRNVMPFVLTSDEVNEYYIRYLGWERVDEIGCYCFAVKPKELNKSGKRYFEGEIWVDDRDLQIVKTYGRSTGYLKSKGQKFPKFETYRQQIDGRYWFPTYTYADDVLNFDAGPQRIKEIIEYKDYKRFKTESVIKYNEASAGTLPETAAPASTPASAPASAPASSTPPPKPPQF